MRTCYSPALSLSLERERTLRFLLLIRKAISYIRPEAGGLMVGLFEAEAAAWNVEQIPEDESYAEIEADWVIFTNKDPCCKFPK